MNCPSCRSIDPSHPKPRGLEIDPLTWNLIVEQIGYGDAGLCESLACSSVPFLLAAVFGTGKMHDRVREYCSDTEGKMIGCFAFSEPDHGPNYVLAAQSEFDDPEIVYR